MQVGTAFRVGISYSVSLPSVVRRPIRLPPPGLSCDSVNHSAPSEADAMPYGHRYPHWAPCRCGNSNSVMSPLTVSRPILLPASSVNHKFPSRPAVIDCGIAFGVGILNSVMWPSTPILPIWLAPDSVNHSAPSGPAAIEVGAAFGFDSGYSLAVPPSSMRPILATDVSANHIAPSGPATMAAGIEPRLGVVKLVKVGVEAG